jgi:pimeloyl-ACP methyl ester carboxylesterase
MAGCSTASLLFFNMQKTDNFQKKAQRVGAMLNAVDNMAPRLAGRLAFELFCRPRRPALNAQDRKFLDSAEQMDFEIPGAVLRGYRWPGPTPDAPAVLLLHGWESSSGRWRKYTKGLNEAGFAVLAFDAPAQGLSGGKRLNLYLYSKAIDVFLAKTGPVVAMIGHSMGAGAAIISMALFEVPRPPKAILLATFAESTRVMADFGRLLGLRDAVLAQTKRQILRRSGHPLEVYSVARQAAQLRDVAGLVLHDQDDAVSPAAEGRAVAEAWGARYIETQGLGHRLQDKTVLTHIIDFLKT